MSVGMHYINRFTSIGSCVIALHINFSIVCFIHFLLFSCTIALRSAYIDDTHNRSSHTSIPASHIQHMNCLKAKFCSHPLQAICLFALMHQFISMMKSLLISLGSLALLFSFYLNIFALSSASHSLFVVQLADTAK